VNKLSGELLTHKHITISGATTTHFHVIASLLDADIVAVACILRLPLQQNLACVLYIATYIAPKSPKQASEQWHHIHIYSMLPDSVLITVPMSRIENV
jgi:hypothetical protein